MKIKEKVLKEELLNQRENENIRYPLDEYWFRTGFDVAWDKFLAEVGKEHKDFIKQLKEEIKFRKQFGQISELEIEIINKKIDKLSKELKQKLGIK